MWDSSKCLIRVKIQIITILKSILPALKELANTNLHRIVESNAFLMEGRNDHVDDKGELFKDFKRKEHIGEMMEENIRVPGFDDKEGFQVTGVDGEGFEGVQGRVVQLVDIDVHGEVG